MRMTGPGPVLLGFMAAALAVAPIHAQESEAPTSGFDGAATSSARAPVSLYVENANWLDVDVYAVRGATRIRIGTVRSQEGRFFEIPARALEAGHSIVLMADPVGSNRTHTTGTVMINPGDVVEWRLANALAQSSIAVWST